MTRRTIRIVCCATILTVTSSLLWQIEANAQAWPNEPANSTLLSECSFAVAVCSGWQAPFGTGHVISDSTAPFSPNNVLQYSIGPGQDSGGGDVTYPLNGLNELYVGFWAKFSNPLIQPDNQLQKVFPVFFNGPSQLFWLLLHGNPNPTGPFYPILQFESTFLNNSHLPGWGDIGGSWNLSPNRSNPVITLGQWHRFELYIKSSSTTTSRDGKVKFWIDGQLTHEYGSNGGTGLNYPNGMTVFQFTPAWTGWTQYNIQSTNYQWFDHVRLSAPNGGGGATGGDTTPPAPPGNLRVN